MTKDPWDCKYRGKVILINKKKYRVYNPEYHPKYEHECLKKKFKGTCPKDQFSMDCYERFDKEAERE